jgi:hypothetical protein
VVCLGGEARNIRKESWNARDYFLARRDISGAVDFAYLEGFAMDDSTVIDEVLALFREQAALWTPMLDKSHPGWPDAVHTVKGAARGVGAFAAGRRLRRGRGRNQEPGRRAQRPGRGPDGHRRLRARAGAAVAEGVGLGAADS